MYISEIVQQWHFVETNAYKKQSFKVWKVITLGSISIFLVVLQHIKNQMKNKMLSLTILCWLLWKDYSL